MITRHRIVQVSAVFFVVCVILVIAKTSSPFGVVFWTGFYLGLLFLIMLVVSLAVYLAGKTSLVLKILSIIPFLMALIMFVVFIMGANDYRSIIPFFISKDLSAMQLADDVDYLEEILHSHPAWTDSGKHILLTLRSKTEFTNDEFTMEVSKVIASFNDGHSFVPTTQLFNKSRFLPLAGFWFDEGFYITDAASEYAELINGKVISYNDVPISEIFERMQPFIGAENKWNLKSRASYYLFSTYSLRHAGIIEGETVSIQFEVDGSRKSIVVDSEPFANWFFWSFKPRSNTNPVGTYQRTPNYRLTGADKNLVLEFNAVQNISEENTIEQLVTEISDSLSLNKYENLVVDIRNNTGGNNTLYDPLIEMILQNSEINNQENLYVLTSRNTFSAAVNFLDDLRYKTNCTIVGEPAGAGATHYGDAETFALPHSGIFLFLSTREWLANDLSDTLNYIQVDVPVDYSFADYKSGRDPWMAAIK